MTDFPCTQCGLCCKLIGKTFDPNSSYYKNSPLSIQTLIDNFPYTINPDGSCSMLSKDGLCTVYEHRPIICNTKLGSKLLNIPESQFYQMLADNCNDLINTYNLDPKYLVQISEALSTS